MNPSETLAPPRTEVRIGALNAEEIAAISKRVKEPEFLARRRAAAWAHCEKTPFPPRTEELWRRTGRLTAGWLENYWSAMVAPARIFSNCGQRTKPIFLIPITRLA